MSAHNPFNNARPSINAYKDQVQWPLSAQSHAAILPCLSPGAATKTSACPYTNPHTNNAQWPISAKHSTNTFVPHGACLQNDQWHVEPKACINACKHNPKEILAQPHVCQISPLACPRPSKVNTAPCSQALQAHEKVLKLHGFNSPSTSSSPNSKVGRHNALASPGSNHDQWVD